MTFALQRLLGARDGVLFFLLAPAVLQLFVTGTFDLGADEAHYMVYARHLDLSYYDHPPLVGWVHFLFNLLLGETLFSARIPAVLIGLFASFQMFRFLGEIGFGERASGWATFGFGICFQFFVLHLFLLPDTLCIALIWPLMRETLRVAEKSSTGAWARLGLWLGLLGLAKYTAVFFVVPVAILILRRQGLSFLRRPGFWLSVLIALALISPVLVWNAQRDWTSFRYQGAHVLGGERGILNFVKSWGAQFATYSPFLWFFSFVGILRLWKSGRDEARFAFWTATTFALFFFYSSWMSPVLPHWPALFYLFAIPVGIAVCFEWRPWVARVPVLLTFAVMFSICALLVSGYGYRIPGALKEVAGWPEFMREATSRLQPGEGVALLNWSYGSRAHYYAPGYRDRIHIVDDRNDQFDLWNPVSPEGRNLWIIQFSYDEKDLSSIVACDALGGREIIPVWARGFHQYDVILRKCEGAKPLISSF